MADKWKNPAFTPCTCPLYLNLLGRSGYMTYGDQGEMKIRGPLVQKLRISRERQQVIKLSVGPF